MKKVRKIQMPYLIVIGVIGVLAIGGLVFAASNSIVNNYYGNTNVDQTATDNVVAGNDEVLGGRVTSIDQDFNGAVTVGGDFTAINKVSTIVIPLDFAQATTSAVGATTLVLGKYRYTGTDDLECSLNGIGAFLDINGKVPYRIDYRITTSTCSVAGSTCGDGTTSFTNTTTYSILKAIEQATSTEISYTLNADDNEGDLTREVFDLTTYDWVVVTGSWTAGGFTTSTMPLTADQGLTATGNAQLNCVKR